MLTPGPLGRGGGWGEEIGTLNLLEIFEKDLKQARFIRRDEALVEGF